jgi:hypothetical protein
MDLLDAKKTNLSIHETPAKGVWVAGITEEVPCPPFFVTVQYVTSEEDITDLLTIGSKNRAVSETQMNKTSSRSHRYFLSV